MDIVLHCTIVADAAREAIATLHAGNVDAIILGCTEVPLMLPDMDADSRLIKLTQLLAEAAVRRALEYRQHVFPISSFVLLREALHNARISVTSCPRRSVHEQRVPMDDRLRVFHISPHRCRPSTNCGANDERIDETVEHQFGFVHLAREYSARYDGVSVFLAETNAGGPVEERVVWFDSLVWKRATRVQRERPSLA